MATGYKVRGVEVTREFFLAYRPGEKVVPAPPGPKAQLHWVRKNIFRNKYDPALRCRYMDWSDRKRAIERVNRVREARGDKKIRECG